MIKSKKQKNPYEMEIDLTGPQGNVFFLIATAKHLARQLGFDGKEIQTKMMSGDYENAVNVFDENFGHFVTLYR